MEEFEKWWADVTIPGKLSISKIHAEMCWNAGKLSTGIIDKLTADINELENSNKALLKKIESLSAHETCACSYDNEGDVCLHHSPKLTQQAAELAAFRGFANDILFWIDESDILIKSVMQRYGLIDENGNKTPLLTQS